MKRILIAGGAGFLGSHLCERLVERGHSVTCVDNFRTGHRRNISHLLWHPRFRLIEHDIVKPLSVSASIDEIYNLACPASPPHYQRDPRYTVMVNVMGVANLIELARYKKARLLQASTSEVYGDPLNDEQSETDWGNVNCTGPRACYDEGKRCAETLLFDEWRQHDLPIKVARIFNTYGPRMQEEDGRIISNFVVQALTDQPMTVYGDGSQTRSFCYVDDLVDGLIRLMDSPASVTGPINLGNPEELTVLRVAHRVAAVLGKRAKVDFNPLPADDPRRRRPNISRAAAVLGWKPTTSLDAGLTKTIAYFRKLLAPVNAHEALPLDNVVSMGAARAASA
ncbi:MAG: SDR family oxidoreductase [Alphaproteobacteria bacterium]|nr:SDR family oxidoreductase [Alphaproteobacteria bacterium]